MKKIFALVLALAMLMSLAACGDKPASTPAETPAPAPTQEPIQPETPEEPEVEEPSTPSDVETPDLPATDTDLPAGDSPALILLTELYNALPEDMRFPAGGGDADNMNMEGPGLYAVADAEGLDAVTGYPAAEIAKISDAATLLHMMNANTFTAGAFTLANAVDSEALVSALKENIVNREWMCGWPETLLIAEIAGVVVSAFGAADLVEAFKTQLVDVFGANILVEEPLM